MKFLIISIDGIECDLTIASSVNNIIDVSLLDNNYSSKLNC